MAIGPPLRRWGVRFGEAREEREVAVPLILHEEGSFELPVSEAALLSSHATDIVVLLLFFSLSKSQAFNVPTWLSLAGCGMLAGFAFGLGQARTDLIWGFGVHVLIIGGFASTRFRAIRREEQSLVIKTMWRKTVLPVEGLRLAVERYLSNSSGPHYSVFARTSDKRVTLAETGSLRSSEKARDRLEEVLLPEATGDP